MRRWLVMIVTVLVGSAATIVVGVAINVTTGGTSPWLPAIEQDPLWWMLGGAIAAAVLAWQAQPWAEQRRLADPAAAVVDFIGLVHDQLSGYLRNTRHSALMPVRWRLVQERWVDHWENVVGALSSAPTVNSGSFEELGNLYSTLRQGRPGRLVILGPAGAGKTVLAATLTEALLTAAQQDPVKPIPVMINFASWDPDTTTLRDWVADRLAQVYKVLDTRDHSGRRLADVLVKDQRKVLPILDGFDELAKDLRPKAISMLNTEIQCPLVLTSRLDEYYAAVENISDQVLKAAAVVQLAPLESEDVAEYLRCSTHRTTAVGTPLWDDVARALQTEIRDGTGSLRAVLTNPLMAFLARAVYSNRSGHNPVDLLNTDGSGPRTDLEDHLLDQFLPAVYDYDDTLPTDRETRSLWPTRRAIMWLTGLAHHLKDTGTRELAWWRLMNLVPERAQVLVAAGFIGLTSMICAVVVGLWREHTLTVVSAYALEGLIFGALVGFFMGKLTQRYRPGLLRYRLRLTTSQLHGGLLPVQIGITFWLLGSALQIPNITYVAVIFTAAGVVVSVFVVPDQEQTAPNPERLLIRSRTTAVINLIVTAVASVLGSWLLDLYGLGIFAVGLPTVLLATVWGRWLLFVRLWLPLRGKLPWRIHAFLADARDRGVLRQSGTIYHFRHARLQDRLAPSDTDTPSTNEAVAAIITQISRTSAGSGKTTTLAKLARELGWEVATARTTLISLIAIGAASAWRENNQPNPSSRRNPQETSHKTDQNHRDVQAHSTPRHPASLADLPEHARFTLHLTAPSTR